MKRLLLLLALPSLAFAQAYPSKPIRLVSSAPLGSSGDVALRLVTAKMTPALGQPLVIENNGAAGGTVAARAIMKSPADGYSFLYSSSGSMVGAPFLTKNTETEVSGRLNDIGITPWGSTPEQFAAALRSDMETMAQLTAKLGIQPQ